MPNPTDSPAIQLTSRPGPPGKASIPWVLLIALIAGILATWLLRFEFQIIFGAALVWGMALYATGVLGGFMFGIPRVPEREAAAAAAAATAASVQASAGQTDGVKVASDELAASKGLRSGINSNLVEVSDWLTKIIVGVGLVELKQLPQHGEALANFMSKSLMPADASKIPDAASIAGAIALYFGVLGFITGYLLTRIFLAVVMNTADRDAEEASQFQLPAGGKISLQGILDSFKRSIDDLQSRMAGFISSTAPPSPVGSAQQAGAASGGGGNAGAGVGGDPRGGPGASVGVPVSVGNSQPGIAAPAIAASNRVLWVDDNPRNNAMIVDRLRQAGISVDTSTNTADALGALGRQSFDLVITDLYRKESAPLVEPAGLGLIRAIREQAIKRGTAPLPLIVYSSRASVNRLADQAKDAGANVVTSSEVDLIASLRSFFPQFG